MIQFLHLLLVFTFSLASFAGSEKGMIESKYFGQIEVDWEEEIYIEKSINVNGRNSRCKLMIEPEIKITSNLANQVDLLENFDNKSRELFKNYSGEKNGMVDSFLQFYLADPSPWLKSELNYTGQLTKEVLLNNLKLIQLHVYPESEESILFVLDYSINPDFTDQLLVVSFHSNGDFFKITSES